MVSAVTPSVVDPPLSAPAGQGTTQDGAYLVGTLTRPSARSQSGAERAASVPTPALVGAATASDATLAAPPVLVPCAVAPRVDVPARWFVTPAPPGVRV